MPPCFEARRGNGIHASFLKRRAPIVRRLPGKLTNGAPRRDGWHRSSGRTQQPQDVLDLQGVEHQLGFTQLAPLLEVTTQQNSSVH